MLQPALHRRPTPSPMDELISPSNTSAAPQQQAGYDYTVGPQPALPNATKPPHSKLYAESLAPKHKQVSLSAFTFLFQEMVVQQRDSSKTVAEIEAKLNALGYAIGMRLVELLPFRDSVPTKASATDGAEALAPAIPMMKKRPLKILDILQYVHGPLWRYLFGAASDDLVKSSERENEYMIVDNEPQWTQFIHGTSIQCESFTGGIIEGVLDHAGFPCHVTVHTDPEGTYDQRTVYLIQFKKQVVEREYLRF
ncbi:AFR408Cp [Eremothecium gossypii ATCC 10895]|uniref:Trafficking protein particle complex subunit n=1 Tax=Eremothecium gossypii (strain ATCC 10895 / CBS 109.51 / FGSC 9923 / NRRL Y-1056) TaxID=284811 RepID=Q753B6_EREGS|nr:AFR408Cp [Eremothecium gossypii ATCC 10895]AAS53779.1 AFR408Cp [Eremothecium gossypii ATCC 10895]